MAAVAAVLLAGKVVGIEAEAAAEDHPVKQVVVADAARPEVVLVAVVETVRIAEVRRQKTAAGAVETALAAVLLLPNVVVAVPSFWRRPTALGKSVQALAVTAAACQVVEEDARPWTSEEEEVEECLPVGIHPMVAAAQAAEADGRAVALESTVAAAVA